MNLTQEQRLAICKFLAEKLGKKILRKQSPVVWLIGESGGGYFDPFTNPAQRWEVLDAAWADGLDPLVSREYAYVAPYTTNGLTPHDNTPDSRAAAVLVAIARAWNYEEKTA